MTSRALLGDNRRLRTCRRFVAALACFIALGGLLTAPAGATPGTLDPSFGDGGRVTAGKGTVVLQSDGRIVSAVGSSGDFRLTRHHADGSLDANFGTGGVVITDFIDSSWDVPTDVAVGPAGRVVAAGFTAPGGYCCQFAVARYAPDGSLDASFGVGGKVVTAFWGNTTALAVAVQSDGKIVVGGYAVDPFASALVLARYDANGSLDATFGTGGKLVTDFGNAWEAAYDVVIDPARRIVVAGSGPEGGLLARYNADGTVDATFGNGGFVNAGVVGSAALALALDPERRIVTVGSNSGRISVARYREDGTPDVDFDGDGVASIVFFGENIEFASDVALQANGRVVVVGTAFHSFDPDYAVARFDQDGTIDESFGVGGKVTTDFADPGGVGDYAGAVAIQADGRIVVGGSTGLARYLGDPTSLAVTLDVRPDSVPNVVSPSSSGFVPVALLSSGSFDAATVDVQTACFGDDEVPAERDCTEAHGRGHIEDVNGDSRPDLVLHYEIQETGIDRGDTVACLTAATSTSGTAVEGCDWIRT